MFLFIIIKVGRLFFSCSLNRNLSVNKKQTVDNKKPLNVFVIHSSITYLISLAIIKNRGINISDVLFLRMRNFAIELKADNHNLPEFKRKKLLNIIANKILFKRYDSFLNTITKGRKYHLYIPHHISDAFYILTSSRNCISYNYIEEGLSSYLRLDIANNRFSTVFKNKLHAIFIPFITRLTFKNRIIVNRNTFDCNHKKYGYAYGLFEYSFPDFFKRKILSPVFPKEETNDLEHVLIIGKEIEAQFIQEEVYIKMLESFFLIFEQVYGGKIIHYKWHPGQSIHIKNVVLNIFKKCKTLSIQELNQNVSLETLSFTTNAIFYQIFSAAGFYAALFGRQVYSFSNIIDSEILRQKTKDVPEIYFQVIKHPKNLDELEVFLKDDKRKMISAIRRNI